MPKGTKEDPAKIEALRTPKPDDLLMEGFGWVELGYDELEAVLVDTAIGTPRATAMRRFADEVGTDFGRVRTEITYVTPLTRQEAWEDYGQEQYNGWEGGPDRVPDDWYPGDGDYYYFSYVRDPSIPSDTPIHKVWRITCH